MTTLLALILGLALPAVLVQAQLFYRCDEPGCLREVKSISFKSANKSRKPTDFKQGNPQQLLTQLQGSGVQVSNNLQLNEGSQCGNLNGDITLVLGLGANVATSMESFLEDDQSRPGGPSSSGFLLVSDDAGSIMRPYQGFTQLAEATATTSYGSDCNPSTLGVQEYTDNPEQVSLLIAEFNCGGSTVIQTTTIQTEIFNELNGTTMSSDIERSDIEITASYTGAMHPYIMGTQDEAMGISGSDGTLGASIICRPPHSMGRSSRSRGRAAIFGAAGALAALAGVGGVFYVKRRKSHVAELHTRMEGQGPASAEAVEALETEAENQDLEA